MKGTNIPHTFEIVFTPPRITAAPRIVTMAPVMYGDIPYWFSTREDIALACTVLPIPKEANAAKIAKRMASHFQPNPFSNAYIGPPSMRPRLVFTRYFTASNPSAYFVDIPNTPVSQHHSTAPGPPSAMAVATPMILPVPIVAASAVARAPNCDTSPVAFLSFLMESLIAFNIFRCGKRNRTVRNIWVPNRRIIIGHPQRNELKAEKKSLIASISLS